MIFKFHWLAHILGLDNATGAWYLFWSGFGGDFAEFVVLVTIIRGIMNLNKKHDRHQQQMKDHIDYKIDKLAEKVDV